MSRHSSDTMQKQKSS